MLLILLILIPSLVGAGIFFIRQEGVVKNLAILASLATLVVSVYLSMLPAGNEMLGFNRVWLGSLNSHFAFGLDGVGKITTLLTAISFPLIFLATKNNKYPNANQFYGLMLLAQAGLMGVFMAMDGLLFYFFWELALIPTYFLCSIWGGEKRIAVSFKFFIYTFVGSVMMLIGIIYLYNKTPDQSFAWESFTNVVLSPKEQAFFFWFFFVAFAIKMPIFPFHTWQPDAYEQAPTATTMVLSGVMVKMGLFAVIRWLLPVFPEMSAKMAPFVIVLCIIGIIYASLIAMRQDDLKRLVAYSSIAHIGLMCATLFTQSQVGYQGVVLQMFNHGINIIGLWIVIDLIEQQTGIRKMSQLGGLAAKNANLAIILVVVALANIALPLTNAFVGEFLMFNGLFQFNKYYALVAGVGIILAAVYTLGMIQKVFLGEEKPNLQLKGMGTAEMISLLVIIAIIFVLGIQPQPLLDMAEQGFNGVLSFANK